jgi:photosystem II stability/assembly factor-like uncharacterized protein
LNECFTQQSPFVLKPDDKENEAEFEKSDGEYAQKRMEFRYKMRANENGIIPFGSLLRAKRMTDELRALPNQPLPMDAGIWNWEWIGPGNIGGRIRTILFHPTNPNTIWIGSVSGGIWRTDYGGSTWYPVDDFMANLAVTSMVMDPTNTNVMYAATGEGFGNLDAVQGAGIFKSYDGGVTWAQLACTNSDSFYNVNRLAHHPTISGLIYCVTARPGGGGEIRRTTDGGITWPLLTTTTNRATDVKIHPQFPNRIFVGTRTGLLSSHDSGTNWFLETNGAANKLPMGVGRCEVAFGNGDTMYVSIQVNNSEVWRSIDSGATWTRRSTANNYLGGQGWYNNVLWISPFNSNFLLLGGVGLGRSTDGGQTFTNMMSFHADQHAIVAHPNYDGVNNRYIYVGNDGGIGFAMDTTSVAGGWQELNNNLGITQFYGGAAHPSGQVIAGGTQDNDKLHFRPGLGTEQWYVGPSYNSTWGDGGATAIDPNNMARMYGEYPGLGFQRSDDTGRTYWRKTNGMTDGYTSNGAWVAPFLIDQNSSNILVAGGTSIWRTRTYAESWYSIRNPIGGNPLALAIDIARDHSDCIWVGYDNGTVSTTNDTGGTWSNVHLNIPISANRAVTDIAINPFDTNDVVVTFGGYQDSSIWRTTDGGATWLYAQGSGLFKIPPVQINTVRFHPLAANWLYVGTELGVFASEDYGVTWSTQPLHSKNEGPVNVAVDELFWQGSDKLIAATHGRGMYRCRPLPVVYVDVNNSGYEDGSWSYPFNSINEALDVSAAGTLVYITSGTYLNAPILHNRRTNIQSTGGTIIIR